MVPPSPSPVWQQKSCLYLKTDCWWSSMIYIQQIKKHCQGRTIETQMMIFCRRRFLFLQNASFLGNTMFLKITIINTQKGCRPSSSSVVVVGGGKIVKKSAFRYCRTYFFPLNISWGSPFLLAVIVLVIIVGSPLFGPPLENGRFIFRSFYMNPHWTPLDRNIYLSLRQASANAPDHRDLTAHRSPLRRRVHQRGICHRGEHWGCTLSNPPPLPWPFGWRRSAGLNSSSSYA